MKFSKNKELPDKQSFIKKIVLKRTKLSTLKYS